MVVCCRSLVTTFSHYLISDLKSTFYQKYDSIFTSIQKLTQISSYSILESWSSCQGWMNRFKWISIMPSGYSGLKNNFTWTPVTFFMPINEFCGKLSLAKMSNFLLLPYFANFKNYIFTQIWFRFIGIGLI